MSSLSIYARSSTIFASFNLKLSPKKCHFEVTQLEYVGHVITSHGIKFSDKKKDKVVDFVLPYTQKDLKRFLGITTYFSDHIRNISIITKCLRDMMLLNEPKSILVWDSDTMKEFELVKKAVNYCPTLFFYSRLSSGVFTHKCLRLRYMGILVSVRPSEQQGISRGFCQQIAEQNRTQLVYNR